MPWSHDLTWSAQGLRMMEVVPKCPSRQLAASLLLLRACGCSPDQFQSLTQPFGFRLPSTDEQFQQLCTGIHCLGHIIERHPGNIANTLHTSFTTTTRCAAWQPNPGHRRYYLVQDGQDDWRQMLQESFYYKGKGKAGNTSGKGFGRRTNPKDRNGQVMRCLVCGSTQHLRARCPQNTRPPGQTTPLARIRYIRHRNAICSQNKCAS